MVSESQHTGPSNQSEPDCVILKENQELTDRFSENGNSGVE